MAKNEVNIEGTQMYRINPKNGWKIIKFDGKNGKMIDGENYSATEFINSEKFTIHEVICFAKVEIGSVREFIHIWYENAN